MGGEGRRFRWWLHGLSTLEADTVEQTGFPDTFPKQENPLCSTVYINLYIGNDDL